MPRNFSVAVAKPRLLVVDVSAPGFEARLINLHFPTAKASKEAKSEMVDLMQEYIIEGKLTLMFADWNARWHIDLNNTTGVSEELVQNATHFRKFIEDNEFLVGPMLGTDAATESTCKVNGKWHVMDYVGVPSNMANGVSHARIYHEIDALNRKDDHLCTGLRVTITKTRNTVNKPWKAVRIDKANMKNPDCAIAFVDVLSYASAIHERVLCPQVNFGGQRVEDLSTFIRCQVQQLVGHIVHP